MGAPTTFTPELAKAICERLATGEPLAVICRDVAAGMPAKRTVSDWRRAHADFNVEFLLARKEGFEAIAAECLAIADDGSRDYVADPKTGAAVVDHDHIQRSKLRIETRLKLLAKWYPTRYGDKVAIEHSGSVRTSTELSDDELARIAAGSGERAAPSPQG